MAKQCKIDIFSKEELKEIVENSNTQVEVLQKLGYGVSGASYKTLRNRINILQTVTISVY